MQILITQGGVTFDATKMKYGSFQLTDNAQAPNLLDFSLFSYSSATAPCTAGAYVQVNTTKYGTIFTGYITTDPQLTYIGTGKLGPQWAFTYEATSEEVLLNKHPLGIIPPFVNTTQGAILKALVSILSPYNVSFNTSGIQDGQFVPRYVVDPNQYFSDVVSSFTQAANYNLRTLNHAITYAPIDASDLTIAVDGSSEHFTPSSLQLQPNSDGVVNRAIVFGNLEPQNYMQEFFAGDGVTGIFSLSSSAWGADSATLLQDNFTGSTINDQNWTVYDATSQVLIPYNGTINVYGGSNNGSLDVYLQSANLIPLEGSLRITHGEYDFVSNSGGVIGGLWTGNTQSNMADCLYGIYVGTLNTNTGLSVSPTTIGVPTQCFLEPMVNGVRDTSQVFFLDFTKRYIFRTIFTTTRNIRTSGTWSYVNGQGEVVQIPGAASADTCSFNTWISEIDPTTGQITRFKTFVSNNVPLSSAQTYAYYCPVVVDWMNLTFTSVTVSSPIQATLKEAARGTFNWVVAPIGPNELDSYDGLAPVAAITDSNTGAVTKSSLLGTKNYNPGNAQLQFFSDSPVALPSSTLAAINPDLSAVPNPIRLPWGAPYGTSTITWANAPSSTMQLWINATTTAAGGTMVATGGQTGSVTLNNIVQGTEFFLMDASHNPAVQVTNMTIETETMYIPQVGDLIWLAYRSAGVSIGVAEDLVSQQAQAEAWGDDGVRCQTYLNMSPLPRTSSDCEIVATAIVGGSNYQHYTGTYTMPSGSWFTGLPISGTIIQFKNLPSSFPSYLQAEAVTQVVTTLDHALGGEVFTHQITFGPLNTQASAMAVLRSTDNVFTPQDSAQIPLAINVQSLGNTTVPDLTSINLTGWNQTTYSFSIPATPPTGGGFEIRYTDAGWGADAGKNLIERTSGSTFSTPRTSRGQVFYVRPYDTRNKCQWSEDFSQWTVSGSATMTSSRTRNPDGNWSKIYTFTAGTGGAFVTLDTGLSLTTAPNNTLFTVSMAGTGSVALGIGNPNSIPFVNQSVTLKGAGAWIRESVALNYVTTTGDIQLTVEIPAGTTVSLTRASFEINPPNGVETMYCKTAGTAYGATSRFSCGVHVGLPLIPAAPTATIDPSSNELTPTIDVVLPQSLSDVWGVEVRASDNATVIYHSDLQDSSYNPVVQCPANTSRTITYYLYTYNVLGDYSVPYEFTYSFPTPSIVGTPTVTVGTKTMNITVANATDLTIAHKQTGNNFIQMTRAVISSGLSLTGQANVQYQIPDDMFFASNTYYLIPNDQIGDGTTTSFTYVYTPNAVTEVTSAEIIDVAPFTTPNTPATVPSAASSIPALYNGLASKNNNLNLAKTS